MTPKAPRHALDASSLERIGAHLLSKLHFGDVTDSDEEMPPYHAAIRRQDSFEVLRTDGS